MERLLWITLDPARCYILQRRIHHFWPGLILWCLGYRKAGLALIIHDLRDWRVWWSDLLVTLEMDLVPQG